MKWTNAQRLGAINIIANALGYETDDFRKSRYIQAIMALTYRSKDVCDWTLDNIILPLPNGKRYAEIIRNTI